MSNKYFLVLIAALLAPAAIDAKLRTTITVSGPVAPKIPWYSSEGQAIIKKAGADFITKHAGNIALCGAASALAIALYKKLPQKKRDRLKCAGVAAALSIGANMFVNATSDREDQNYVFKLGYYTFLFAFSFEAILFEHAKHPYCKPWTSSLSVQEEANSARIGWYGTLIGFWGTIIASTALQKIVDSYK